MISKGYQWTNSLYDRPGTFLIGLIRRYSKKKSTLCTRINDKALSWIPEEEIEAKALQQIKNLSTMPFIFRHVGIMPDCHYGKGATIGSVIPTQGAVIPAAVGVDIGCGMRAVRTSLKADDLFEDLSYIRKDIEQAIPLSAGKYNRHIEDTAVERIKLLEDFAYGKTYRSLHSYEELSPNWRKQLGTLGSGNHFIEIVLDEEDNVWTSYIPAVEVSGIKSLSTISLKLKGLWIFTTLIYLILIWPISLRIHLNTITIYRI